MKPCSAYWKRRSRFRYDPENERYCETEAAKKRELLVAEHVGEGDGGAAEEVAAAGQADVHRRPALEVELLERPLRLTLASTIGG